MKEPVIDMACCILCDICTAVAPEVFVHNDLGFIEVLPGADTETEAVREAVRNCPKDCITLE